MTRFFSNDRFGLNRTGSLSIVSELIADYVTRISWRK